MLEERKSKRPRVTKVDPYEAPKELVEANNPGPLLKWCLMHCYGTVKEYQKALYGRFQVARQTVYKWVNNGVPFDRKDDFSEFAEDRKVIFALPTNASVDQFLRPERSRYEAASGEQNTFLLEFLFRCVSEGGLHTLEDMAKAMRNVKSPHLFFKWGYNDSGVPVTYIEDFITNALLKKLYLFMEEDGLREDERFAAHVRARMCADPDYARQFYGVSSA